MSIFLLIAILMLCLLAEGFFSGSEMAVVSAQKYHLAIRTDEGCKRARMALHFVKQPAIFFSTTLIGTNLCTVTGTVVTTFFIIGNYGEIYAPFAILFWPLTLLLGEMIPKSIYQYYADRLVLKVVPILFVVSWVFYPLVWPLSKLTNFLLGDVKNKFGSEPPLTREELEIILEEEQSLGDVNFSERAMISRILDLADKKVANIMTPLVDIVSVPIDASREEAARVMEDFEYSRVLVYQGQAFNIIGVLNGSDILFSDDNAKVKDLFHPAYYVPENMPLDTLLITMKRRGRPLAVVVDEFGTATGIVTSEDLLEEVVGEIRDEHDKEAIFSLYQRVGHNRYIVSGRMEIEKANERLKLNIPKGDYETIAGFLLKNTEKIPKIGDSMTFGDYIYTIRRANERAVLEIEVNKIIERGV